MPISLIGTDFDSVRVAADRVRLLTEKKNNYGRKKKFKCSGKAAKVIDLV